MSSRARIITAAAVAAVAAVAFGAFSFLREVDSIHRRQGVDAAQCATLVREARELVEQSRMADTGNADPCRAHEMVDRAIATMRKAQSMCRRALDQDPLLTSDAAIARMTASRSELAARCSRGL